MAPGTRSNWSRLVASLSLGNYEIIDQVYSLGKMAIFVVRSESNVIVEETIYLFNLFNDFIFLLSHILVVYNNIIILFKLAT